MHQITKKICYLYDMHIVYCVLKLEDILINIMEIKIIDKTIQYISIKVVDFRMSKIEIGRNPKTTQSNIAYGSC